MNRTLANDQKRIFSSAESVAELAKHSSAETMKENGLDWAVEKRIVQYSHNNETKLFTDQYVLTRQDKGTPLGIVGKDYQVIQNTKSFDFFDNMTIIGGVAEYLKAGSTRGGQRIFIEARLTDDNLQVKQGDQLEKRLYLWNSHGKDSFKVFFVPFRLACQNQLTGTFNKNVYEQYTNKGKITGVRIIHKGNMESKLEEAQKIINNAVIHFEAAQAVYKHMEEIKLTEGQAKNFYQSLTLTKKEANGEEPSARIKNQRETMLDLFRSGKGNRGVSLWDAYNGATEWSDHKRSLKETTEKVENRFFGSGGTFKQNALNLAVGYLLGDSSIKF